MAKAEKGTLRLGASSWTGKGWLGTFYPSGAKQADFIAHYAERYDTVEIDSTFYGIPRKSTVEGWRDRTPESFTFSAKIPQVVTHEKFLEDVGEDIQTFLATMEILGPRLGPLLFQFPYFAKKKNVELDDFLERLAPVLAMLPKDHFTFCVEVRNKTWLKPKLFDLLGEHGIPLVLIDHPWMAPPQKLLETKGIVTGPFSYVRWLGDRYAIEKITKTFNESVIDQSERMAEWQPGIERMLDQGIDVYGYVNNHYSGYAPHDIEYFRKLME